MVITFESGWAAYQRWAPPAWAAGYPHERFWHLVYGVGAEALDAALRLARERRAGWLYLTPDDLPNPWDTLPPDAYWVRERRAARRR